MTTKIYPGIVKCFLEGAKSLLTENTDRPGRKLVMQEREEIAIRTKPLSRQEVMGFSCECSWMATVKIYDRDLNLDRYWKEGPVGGPLTHCVPARAL